jgi:diketogulonate reductase-like aldo/keto reductase
MCRTLGLALAPWGALGGGKYKTDEQIAEQKKRNEEGRKPFTPPTDEDKAITKVLDKIAKSKGEGIGITGIALAYVMHKAPDVYPIIGVRKVEQIKENIAALKVKLSHKEIKEIEEAGGEFKMGFPHNFLGGGEGGAHGPSDVAMLKRSGHHDFHPVKGVTLCQIKLISAHLAKPLG